MADEKTASEPKRGCGFRQVGKLYLIGEGYAHLCPSLPLTLEPCEICGYVPAQYRDFTWVPKAYFKALKLKNPTGKPCVTNCPVCYPESSNTQEKYGLMWVGQKHYTPEEFIAEDKKMGVCKAIKQKPKGLVLGESWVLLAHPQAGAWDYEDPGYLEARARWHERGETGLEPNKPPRTPGIFYAFIPTRIEVLVYRHLARPVRLADLKAKGITPVIIDDKHKAHARKTRKVTGRANIA